MKNTVTGGWIDIGKKENTKRFQAKMWILDAVALDRRIIRLRRYNVSLNHHFIYSLIHSLIVSLRAGFRVVRMDLDPLRFLARCRTRQLNQA